MFFAQPEHLWREKHLGWTDHISGLLPDKEIIFELATFDNFQAAARRNNLLYVYGGDSKRLIRSLKEIKNYDSLIDGFVKVLGSSAGAIMLSRYAWDCDVREIEQGLGFVNCKTLVHWQSSTYGIDDPRGAINWDAALEQLQAYAEELPIQKLPEGKFIVA